MTLVPSIRIPVSHSSDVSEARRLLKTIANELGFSKMESEELAIVASEMASNLVKHARGGQIILTAVEDGDRLGIRIESLDNGPGIADADQVITDGFSTAGSMGCGLGAINRLMDEFEIRPRPDGMTGTQIICMRWRRENFQGRGTCPLSYAVATRAYHIIGPNGDSFVIKTWKEFSLVALIDGLGHGQQAHQAAQATREYIENHYDQSLEALFLGVERICRGTRGVVMAVARFDCRITPIKISFAAVGNIEARVFGSPSPMNFIMRRGVIGSNAPKPVITEQSWNPEYILVLHTDGLKTIWSWSDFPELASMPATQTAQRLLQKLAKDNDDATVVVVRKR